MSQRLLLIPGTLCDQRLWAQQITGLADIAECSVADVSQDDSLPAMARRVLTGAPKRFALAGFSLGAILAFEVYRQAPERITHLALLDGNPYADLPERHSARLDALRYLQEQNLEALLRNTLMPLYVHPSRLGDQTLTGIITAMALDLGPEVFKRQTQALVGRPDNRELFTRINCPTLALCGDSDRLCLPAWYESMAAQMPRARLVIVPECGHFTPLERPAVVTAALWHWLEEEI